MANAHRRRTSGRSVRGTVSVIVAYLASERCRRDADCSFFTEPATENEMQPISSFWTPRPNEGDEYFCTFLCATARSRQRYERQACGEEQQIDHDNIDPIMLRRIPVSIVDETEQMGTFEKIVLV